MLNLYYNDGNLNTTVSNVKNRIEEYTIKRINDLVQSGQLKEYFDEGDVYGYDSLMTERDSNVKINTVEKSEILHQDILDTTLLDEGAARREFDDFKEAYVVAEIDANVFIPDFVLEKDSSNPTVAKEILERETHSGKSSSIGKAHIEGIFNDELEKLYRKLSTYANTQTPLQMRKQFSSTFSNLAERQSPPYA